MTLSSKNKEMLISIEKCERSIGLEKITSRLRQAKEKIEKPFNDKIKEIENERLKALINANLLYIDNGCGRQHPEVDEFQKETNERLKKILRE